MNFWWYIIIGEAVAIIIFIILAMRKKWRIDHGTGDDPVEHYTEKRDELSGLEDEDVEEDEEDISSVSLRFNPIKLLTALITTGIVFYVGYQILMTLQDEVINNPAINTTLSTGESTLITNAFSFLPIIAIIGFVFVILSAFGLGGGSSSDEDEAEYEHEKPKKKPRKKGVEHYTAARDTMSKKVKK